MSLRESTLLLGIVSCLAPFVAVFLRQGGRILKLATLSVALSSGLLLFALLRLVQLGPSTTPNAWVLALIASGTPMLLGGYGLSVCLGREHPLEALRRSRTMLAFLGALGLAFMLLLRRSSFVTGYNWDDGNGTIHLGALGKAYVTYLLVGIVLTGYNLESTYRLASSNFRYRLRLPSLAIFGVLGFLMFVLTTGLLYSSLGLGKLVAAAIPLLLANLVMAATFLRGALTDVAAPVSRTIVYSSFTAIAAGLYVLAVGVVAQVAEFTNWSPDEIVTLTVGFMAVLLAVLLLLSNRFQRRMRRFIDRNFYANRYDYRTQWSNVIQALEDASGTDGVLQSARGLLESVFDADAITIALRVEASQAIRPRLGKGTDNPTAALQFGSPLALSMIKERRAMLLNRRADDFEYICMYVENRTWVDATASQIVVPLLDGNHLIGCLGLERSQGADPFTYEDVTLLDSVALHIASKLREARHTEELAETREMNLIAQWSNMLLHDLKNYLAPLRLVAHNLVQHQEKPGIAAMAAGDILTVTDRMETFARSLSELRDNSHALRTPIDFNALVRKTLGEMHVDRRTGLKTELHLRSETPVMGDQSMLQRVLENLVANAVEAMKDDGTLTIETWDRAHPNNGATVHVAVRDTGSGIAPDFLRDHLFHPFATTKKSGMGLGLYQSRAIVRAHGGELLVESELGAGTTVQILIDAGTTANAAADGPMQRTPRGLVA